ncbi:Halocyanin [Chitinispirillum alkaliphilum]|nr:Halocyanin [Chitinispirillum alkaliphilum]
MNLKNYAGTLVFIVSITLAGCNRSAAQNGSESEMDNPPVIIEMTQLRFEPQSVTVPVNGTVKWINTSGTNHTVTADSSLADDPSNVVLPDGAEPFNSNTLEPDEEFEYSFTVPGRYRYFCIPHEHLGMIGEVIVEP